MIKWVELSCRKIAVPTQWCKGLFALSCPRAFLSHLGLHHAAFFNVKEWAAACDSRELPVLLDQQVMQMPSPSISLGACEWQCTAWPTIKLCISCKVATASSDVLEMTRPCSSRALTWVLRCHGQACMIQGSALGQQTNDSIL